MLIGVISDTHGRFHAAIPAHFADVALILHAGDIGNQGIVTQLEALAPVRVVTGNVDWGGPLDRVYRRVEQLEVDGCRIYMTHIGGLPKDVLKRVPTPKPDVYICGHSHVPLLEQHDGVLFLNPGSAGAPRFGRKPSLARLVIENGVARAELIGL